MTHRLLLAIALFTMIVTVNASGQCPGVVHRETIECSCGGTAVLSTCQGNGNSCSPATGQNTQCRTNCDLINAGGCFAARKLNIDKLEAQHSLLSQVEVSKGCGAKGQMKFEEWLQIKLQEQSRRADVNTRKNENAI